MTDTSEVRASSARPSDEMLPFLNNFHDIFTTIGVLILLGGLAVGAGQVMVGLDLIEGEQAWQNALMALIGGIGILRKVLPIAAGFGLAATIAGLVKLELPLKYAVLLGVMTFVIGSLVTLKSMLGRTYDKFNAAEQQRIRDSAADLLASL